MRKAQEEKNKKFFSSPRLIFQRRFSSEAIEEEDIVKYFEKEETDEASSLIEEERIATRDLLKWKREDENNNNNYNNSLPSESMNFPLNESLNSDYVASGSIHRRKGNSFGKIPQILEEEEEKKLKWKFCPHCGEKLWKEMESLSLNVNANIDVGKE